MIVRETKINSFDEAKQLAVSVGCDSYAYDMLAKKMTERVILIDGIDNKAVNILKQEALTCSADAAVTRDICKFKKGVSKAVLFGTEKQIEKIILKLKLQPFGLKELAVKLENILNNKKRIIVCGRKKINVSKRSLVMGIVNLSPDSFYGDGINEAKIAEHHALDMEEAGADILDIGAESTRPGSRPLSVKEEISRITKFMKLIVKKTKLPVSVDTYKPEVAKAAIAEGADIINDIYALRYDKSKMADVAAKTGAGVILMHMQGTPFNMQKKIKYKDIMLEIFNFLSRQIEFALQSGVNKNSIIVDPGIGFGKTAEDNLMILKHLYTLKALGYPVLFAASNKRFLAQIANVKELKERLVASTTAHVLAASNGADIVRVHNVKQMVQALSVFNAVRSV